MGLQIEHYINSSGLQEMVEGSPIAHEFKHIYASRPKVIREDKLCETIEMDVGT